MQDNTVPGAQAPAMNYRGPTQHMGASPTVAYDGSGLTPFPIPRPPMVNTFTWCQWALIRVTYI